MYFRRYDLSGNDAVDATAYAYAEKKKPTTNAGLIRQMSDEELADFIGGIFTIETDIWGDYDPRIVVTQEPRVEIRDKEGMMDWLKSPVEVDE